MVKKYGNQGKLKTKWVLGLAIIKDGKTFTYEGITNEFYYGCSSKIKIPSSILNSMNQNKRLSDVVASHTDYTEDEIRNYGTNGLLTNGEYTRTDEFMDSILCALSSKFKKI